MNRIKILLVLMLISPWMIYGTETVCSRVKIEIAQELTLERQGFEATMAINNGLDSDSITDIDVDVIFTDKEGNEQLASSDPNNLDAKFFIRISSEENVVEENGNKSISPSTEGIIRWLIIPAPGTGGEDPKGTEYLVGAKLTYKVKGVEDTVNVVPDSIFVKPMPLLVLDYFIPNEVYADDPILTPDVVEPPVPFSLGVRVRNTGSGAAHKLKIESGQPVITENEQGLLIGFKLHGTEVDGVTVDDSLLADFGTVEADSASVARWIMTTTLSGRFVSFSASFSHDDELGGALTSLIEEVNTHIMVNDVLVDAPGKDLVRDFLAFENSQTLKVFESDNLDTIVENQSIDATFDGSVLTRPAFSGYVYVKKPMNSTTQVIGKVVRNDGKVINPANA